MTMMGEIMCKCAVCGEESEHSIIMSTNAFGSPDLDLRPPEMRRSTMSLWLQKCPKCGYVASNIEEESGVSAEFLKSEEYVSCEGVKFKSGLARKFYRHSLISRKAGNSEDEFFDLLHASWACDDKRDAQNAKMCREKAAVLVKGLLEGWKLSSDEQENYTLMLADILRRSGQFEALISEYSSFKFKGSRRNDPELMNKLLAFEIERAKQQDTKCYTVSDALGK